MKLKKNSVFAVIISIALAAGTLAGCSGSSGSSDTQQETQVAGSANGEQDVQGSVLPDGTGAEEPDLEPKEPKGSESDSQDPESGSQESEPGSQGEEGGMSIGTVTEGNGSGVVIENAPYVMIYNPNIYDQNIKVKNYITSLTSGDMSKQIVVTMGRADGMEAVDYEFPQLVSQEEINQSFIHLNGAKNEESMHKGDGLDPVYSLGDTHKFYCFELDMDTRTKKEFECVYEGEKCYIWVLDDAVSEEDARTLGEEFDTRIYQMDTDMFGPARFMQNGGKLNILFYPMMRGLGGFFCRADLLTADDLNNPLEAEVYGYNLDHAIINVNSDMVARNLEYVKSTLAHEFQHLIVGSDYFMSENTPYMRTWLNEAMSAFAEDYVYPGIKAQNGYNFALYASDNFRTGQSLYNFDTANDINIGAYGAVYLFSKYLTEYCDHDIYRRLHEYWRASDSKDLSEAEALYNTVTDSFREEISGKYTYPEMVENRFDTPEEEWMSKMTLDYFIQTLDMNFSLMADKAPFIRWLMLYKEINKQRIQGGGRLVVATENGSYEIPMDADEGLIYVGLDQYFQVIPESITVK